MLKKLGLNTLLLATLLMGFLPAAEAAPLAVPLAQSANLVVNGGFESGQGSWLQWWSESAKPSDGTFNYASKPNSFNVESVSTGASAQLVVAGDKSYRVINNWDPWFAGIKQTVAAPAGSQVRLTASARLWTSSNNWPDPSDTTVNAVTRVGIEPNGNDNQFVGTVVWSGGATPHNGWQTQSVDAVVGASGKVTIILSADYRGYSRLFLGAYWDEVSLTVISTEPQPQPTSGGGGGPQPTARPIVVTPIASPTPGLDGNIIYVVQLGDTLTSICVSIGEPNYDCVNRIRQLNNMTSDILSVGQRLVIGQGLPSIPPTNTPDPNAATSEPTAQPTATLAPEAASPTPVSTGKICVLVYNDANGSGFRDASEGNLAGGQIAVVEVATGQPVQVYTTDGSTAEPHCFENLPVGDYTVSSAAPAGYNSTTEAATTLRVEAGTTSSLEFGAQPGNAVTPTGGASANDRLTKALVGAAGVVFLLLAAGIAGFFFLRRK